MSVVPISFPTGGVTSEEVTAERKHVRSGLTALMKDSADAPGVGAMRELSGRVYTPGSADQVIAEDNYLNGNQIILGDTNLNPSNIITGKRIFQVSGSASPQKSLHISGLSPAGTMGFDTTTSRVGRPYLELSNFGFWPWMIFVWESFIRNEGHDTWAYVRGATDVYRQFLTRRTSSSVYSTDFVIDGTNLVIQNNFIRVPVGESSPYYEIQAWGY